MIGFFAQEYKYFSVSFVSENLDVILMLVLLWVTYFIPLASRIYSLILIFCNLYPCVSEFPLWDTFLIRLRKWFYWHFLFAVHWFYLLQNCSLKHSWVYCHLGMGKLRLIYLESFAWLCTESESHVLWFGALPIFLCY